LKDECDKQNNVDDILEKSPKESRWFGMLSEYWPISSLPTKNAGFRTRDGYQVHYEWMVGLAADLLQLIPVDDVLKFHLYLCERLRVEREKIRNEKGMHCGAIIVEDTTGLSFGHLIGSNMNLLQKLLETESLYYPESLRKVYLINCPPLFVTAWRIMKRMLDEGTIEKNGNFRAELQ